MGIERLIKVEKVAGSVPGWEFSLKPLKPIVVPVSLPDSIGSLAFMICFKGSS